MPGAYASGTAYQEKINQGYTQDEAENKHGEAYAMPAELFKTVEPDQGE